jgi:hypothetical protein
MFQRSVRRGNHAATNPDFCLFLVEARLKCPGCDFLEMSGFEVQKISILKGF